MIGLILLQQLPLLVVGLFATLPKAYRTSQMVTLIGWLFLLGSALITWLMWHYYQKIKGPHYTDVPLNKQRWLTLIIGLLAMMIINKVTSPFVQPTGNGNVDALTDLLKTLGLYMLPFVVILGPIMEELLFRGFLMNWFFVGKPIISCLLSALLFGLMHGASDPIYFLSKALLGLVLAIVYYRNQNIKSNISLHILNNLSAGLVAF